MRRYSLMRSPRITTVASNISRTWSKPAATPAATTVGSVTHDQTTHSTRLQCQRSHRRCHRRCHRHTNRRSCRTCRCHRRTISNRHGRHRPGHRRRHRYPHRTRFQQPGLGLRHDGLRAVPPHIDRAAHANVGVRQAGDLRVRGLPTSLQNPSALEFSENVRAVTAGGHNTPHAKRNYATVCASIKLMAHKDACARWLAFGLCRDPQCDKLHRQLADASKR